jgi:hypothetical protein
MALSSVALKMLVVKERTAGTVHLKGLPLDAQLKDSTLFHECTKADTGMTTNEDQCKLLHEVISS